MPGPPERISSDRHRRSRDDGDQEQCQSRAHHDEDPLLQARTERIAQSSIPCIINESSPPCVSRDSRCRYRARCGACRRARLHPPAIAHPSLDGDHAHWLHLYHLDVRRGRASATSDALSNEGARPHAAPKPHASPRVAEDRVCRWPASRRIADDKTSRERHDVVLGRGSFGGEISQYHVMICCLWMANLPSEIAGGRSRQIQSDRPPAPGQLRWSRLRSLREGEMVGHHMGIPEWHVA
jgi:hypothetical protein